MGKASLGGSVTKAPCQRCPNPASPKGKVIRNWLNAAPSPRWVPDKGTKVKQLTYLQANSSTPKRFKNPAYSLGFRGKFTPELLRVIASLSASLVWPIFVIYAASGRGQVSDWPPFAIAWIVLLCILWDFRILRLPDDVNYVTKEYYETVRLRVTYAATLGVLFAAILAAQVVIPVVAPFLAGHPVNRTVSLEHLSVLGSVLGVASVIALRATNSAAREEAIYFARLCDEGSRRQFLSKAECPQRPGVPCPLKARGVGSVNRGRTRQPRRAIAVNIISAIIGTGVTIAGIRLGSEGPPSESVSIQPLAYYFLAVSIVTISIWWLTSAFPNHVGGRILIFEQWIDDQMQKNRILAVVAWLMFTIVACALPLVLAICS